MEYSEYSHRHNFSIWAAARAAQRGFTNVEMLRNALERCGIDIYIKSPCQKCDFDDSHKKWCNSICDYLNEKGVKNVTYGRAAKLVNVYLKSMVVLNDLSGEEAGYIHPPLDRILLQNIARNPGLEKSAKKTIKKSNWTQLEEKGYFDLIAILKEINGNQPFWMIEEYWTVTNE